MRYRSVIIVAVVVLFVLLLAARFRDSLQDRPKANPGSSTVAASETGTAGESSGGEPRPVPALPVRNGSAGSDGTPGPPVPIATPAPADGSASRLPPLPAADVPIQEWEERIDTILAGNIDEGIKVDRLLQLFPTLPEDGQIEAAEHLSNLLPDELYPELGQTLTNATASEEVLDVLMTDVLNRPNGIKLPALLDVARTPGHPMAEEAVDVLEVFIDENHGTDWSAWRKAVLAWLAENPDE